MTDSLTNPYRPISPDEKFAFCCHPGVPCFTECCRELDLALTPYDVLRLKNGRKTHSGRFLEQYVIIEWDEQQLFPTCYLTMVDDGRASCVFVKEQGCSVYQDRPSSCRAYPVGRGAARKSDGSIEESFVLLREPHCQGFAEQQQQDVGSYFTDQELASYNRFNDALLALLQHEQIQQGFRPSREQLDQYILALYNLDMFRQEMADGRLSMQRPLTASELQGLAGDDEQLLLLGIQWLIQEFFSA
ncbi:YkgJ family cysteine cluster protein [Desulfogranum mediterraneum]|uniref:YkgJ family cysteine cluster protein n=1 Tax=Desulfogranum mediterraneum TaxID=160661 RepID=UPI00048EAADA|nr:YkgJ family cysteine cluster protein [Desulfogranum mediterraneum]